MTSECDLDMNCINTHFIDFIHTFCVHIVDSVLLTCLPTSSRGVAIVCSVNRLDSYIKHTGIAGITPYLLYSAPYLPSTILYECLNSKWDRPGQAIGAPRIISVVWPADYAWRPELKMQMKWVNQSENDPGQLQSIRTVDLQPWHLQPWHTMPRLRCIGLDRTEETQIFWGLVINGWTLALHSANHLANIFL